MRQKRSHCQKLQIVQIVRYTERLLQEVSSFVREEMPVCSGYIVIKRLGYIPFHQKLAVPIFISLKILSVLVKYSWTSLQKLSHRESLLIKGLI